jgi:hypothetical protein
MMAGKPTGRPEDELLLACARVHVNSERIRSLLAADPDWAYLREAAKRHRVLPLLAESLGECGASVVPAEELVFLQEFAKQVGCLNLHLTSKLLAILERFEKQGIAVVPYKGPVLAALAYENLSLRQFQDLDLVLAHRELPRAWAALEAEGYRAEDNAAPRALSEKVAPGQYVFLAPGKDFLVELHTDRTLRYFPRRLAPERLTRNLEAVRLAGRHVLTFSPEDTLIFLAVHGTKHFWDRLLWISDIARLAAVPGIDWEKALEAAQELSCGRLLRLAILLAGDLLAAPVPPAIVDRARADRAALALARAVRERLFAAPPHSFKRLRFRMEMVEGFWPGARYAWQLATAPTAEDRDAVRVPPGLDFLYRIIRPLRLLGRRDKR